MAEYRRISIRHESQEQGHSVGSILNAPACGNRVSHVFSSFISSSRKASADVLNARHFRGVAFRRSQIRPHILIRQRQQCPYRMADGGEPCLVPMPVSISHQDVNSHPRPKVMLRRASTGRGDASWISRFIRGRDLRSVISPGRL
jgi:hypothetical protein